MLAPRPAAPRFRDFQYPGRSPVLGTQAMVATSQPSATMAGLDILRAGGNAVDAAIAAGAVQAVTEPEATGIGGDCFCLVAPRDGAVIALNGSGMAPAALSAQGLADQGITALEETSAHCVTVPGAIDAWVRLSADHGRLPLDQVLAPAIRLAAEGFPIHERAAFDWQRNVAKLSHDPVTKARFLDGGAARAMGTIFRQPELAETLKLIAAKGRAGFYEGPVAEDIVARLNEAGGLHTLDDFAAQVSRYETAISAGFRGLDVYECPPNGVGVAALQIMKVLERLPVDDDPLGVDRLHRLIEATRLVFRDRDAFVADPAHAPVPVDALLSDARADAFAALIGDKALADLPPVDLPPHSDTVYLSVVDRDGMAVSFINSHFKEFGSGMIGPKSGVLLHNRGFSFSLDPTHPNALAGRKRPLHTIIPAIARKGGRNQATFGVMGGHYQPIGQAWVLSSIVDFGMNMQAAIDLPRAFTYDNRTQIEDGVPDAVAETLTARGHEMWRGKAPIGGGQGIWIDHDNGVLVGGSDPRKDGCALGW